MAFFIAAYVLSLSFAVFMLHHGWDDDAVGTSSSSTILPWRDFMSRLAFTIFVSAVVESLPIDEWDNVTVFIAGLCADACYVHAGSFGLI